MSGEARTENQITAGEPGERSEPQDTAGRKNARQIDGGDLSPVLVIELWPIWFSCHRCHVDTRDSFCWPYYEEFIHSESTIDHGYVPVCKPCHDWLVSNEATLWRRAA